MIDSPGLVVQPLEDRYLDDVVRLHRTGLGYSINSQLGDDHLAFLYRTMAHDPQSYVGLAFDEDRPVGIVSGAVDAALLKSRMLRLMPAARIASLAARFLVHPWLLRDLWKESLIAAPLRYGTGNVAAVLTAISVDPTSRGKGIGRHLVSALEQFFAMHEVKCYRLDTLIANTGARAFYQGLGFLQVVERADSLIFVKVIRR